MERLILTAEVELHDEAYLNELIGTIYDAPRFARTIENDYNGEVRCEVTVRRFVDPAISRVRWAMVLDGDEFEIRDYATKSEAMAAYREFVRKCAADDVHWAESDVYRVECFA